VEQLPVVGRPVLLDVPSRRLDQLIGAEDLSLGAVLWVLHLGAEPWGLPHDLRWPPLIDGYGTGLAAGTA
jgi:hypothetical protein